jgi:hypothetical protein
VKNILYNGPKLSIRPDGIRIRRRKLTLDYPGITSITVKKARLTRGWLGLILLGITLDITLVYILYIFLDNYYDLSGLNGIHVHYSRRSPGIVIGILLALPVFITFRIMRYFSRPLMLIIRWKDGEFRMPFRELGISVGELKQYLEGKVPLVMGEE